MVEFYIMMIRKGVITLADVPEKWIEEVRKIMEHNAT